MTTQTQSDAASLARFEEESARYFRRNFAAGLIHGIFFQMSAAFGNVNTVLPAFVALLTPSTLAVGLMAAVQGIGDIVPQFFTAYLIEGKERKKPILLGVITIRFIAWALLAWLTFRIGDSRPEIVLAVLLTFFTLFSLAGGVGTVVYADIFARAIPAERRGSFTGWRQLLGFTLAIAAGYVVKLILDEGSGLAFPSNYALIFALSALTLGIAFSGFALIREPVYPLRRKAETLGAMLRRSVVLVRANRNFRRLLLARALVMAGLALAPFYVVYARNELNVNAGMVGVYLSMQMGGAALSNLLWGWLGDRYGNKPVVAGTALAGMLAPLLALLTPASRPELYAIVFALIGATMSGMRLGHVNFLLEMAPPEIRPTCVALQNTLLTPAALLPLVVGALIQTLSYPILLGAGAALMLLSLLLALSLLDPRHGPEGACLE